MIKHHKRLRKEFDHFMHQREDTFTFGVCNGCQLLVRRGDLPVDHMKANKSGRFESRWAATLITSDQPPFFTGMKGAVLGVWVAHAEGRFKHFTAQPALSYVDGHHIQTLKYPHNPNGSHEGAAGFTSTNGRILGLMPHPERSILKWQAPYWEDGSDSEFTGWRRLFTNAYEWAKKQ